MTAPLTMPRRITPLAPIGSLLKRAREKRSPRKVRTVDLSHLAAIRQLPCLRCGLEPCGEAAHVRMSSAALGKQQSLGRRPSDEFAAPLCSSCHRCDADSQHKVGEPIFWQALGLNPLLICEHLYQASPDVGRMRAVVLSAIASRPNGDRT